MNNQVPKIHPELQQIAKKIPKVNYSKRNLWLFNSLMRLMPSPKELDSVQVENTFIPRQDDQTNIRLRIYRPKTASAPTPVLLWIHGGGYIMGKPEIDDVSCSLFVRELAIVRALP